MKRKTIIWSTLIVFGLNITGLQAQVAISASGGDVSDSGGSISYTIGQVVYSTHAGTNGNSVAQGVQQPFVIEVISEISEAKDIHFSAFAYPNPTRNYLTLKVENYETENLKYQIFDLNGQLLQSQKATGEETQIETHKLVPANYFIKVLDKEKEIKVFKIIKN